MNAYKKLEPAIEIGQATIDHLKGENYALLELLQQVQEAITFDTEEQAKSSSYGLPFSLAKKIYITLNAAEQMRAPDLAKAARSDECIHGVLFCDDPGCWRNSPSG